MFEQTFKNIDGVFCKAAGCTTELDNTLHKSSDLLQYTEDRMRR